MKNIAEILNGGHAEYNPVTNADESVMFFTSQRPGTTGGQISEEDFHYYEDIYYYTQDQSKQETGDHEYKINL